MNEKMHGAIIVIIIALLIIGFQVSIVITEIQTTSLREASIGERVVIPPDTLLIVDYRNGRFTLSNGISIDPDLAFELMVKE